MLFLVLFLIVLPFIYGRVFLKNEYANRLLAIPCGLMVELVLWAMVSIPVVYRQGNLSTAVNIYLICNTLLAVFCIIYIFKQSSGNVKPKDIIDGVRLRVVELFHNKVFLVMLVLVLLQAVRVSLFQFNYGDNRVYTAMVNDMVETDEFYTVDEDNGAVRVDTSTVETKFVIASWYTFEAFLSKVSDIRPLVIIYTLLPGYLMLLIYLTWWELSGCFLDNDISKRSMLIIMMALLYEFIWEDLSSYVLIWATYGKNITANIVMPLFILFWIFYIKSKRLPEYLFLVILTAAGCAASTMGLMIMPIMISFLHLIEVIRQKKITLQTVTGYVGLFIPIAVYALLFIGK